MSDLIRPAVQMGGQARPVESRYIIPSFVERTTYGVKEMNPYNKLFEERIIFLGIQIDDASANDVMAQLLTLESIDPDRDISIYINSPGGSFTAMTAIYDTMQFVKPDIQTVCIGQAASAAAVLLAAGTPGQAGGAAALADPDPPAGHRGHDGQVERPGDPGPRDHADAGAARGDPRPALGQDIEAVRRDIERDKILTAEEAKDVRLDRRRLRKQEAPRRGSVVLKGADRPRSAAAQAPEAAE